MGKTTQTTQEKDEDEKDVGKDKKKIMKEKRITLTQVLFEEIYSKEQLQNIKDK
jgi:hypothetical protein